MHWLVGMLLHAVCVFFFKGVKKKKKLVEKLTWGWGGGVPTHFLASMVLLIWNNIPFMSAFDFMFQMLFQTSSLLCFEADGGVQPPFFVLVWLCSYIAFIL